MTTKKTLVCFTASYPFGLKETFFHNELPFLAESFDEVVIFPRYNPSGSNQKREVPNNVICHDPLVSTDKLVRGYQGILNTSPIKNHFIEFFKHKVFFSSCKLKSWLNSFFVYRKTYSEVRKHLKYYHHSNVVLYSYWADIPLFLTRLCARYKKVVRMHRGDYYLEENNGYLPLRQEIYNQADLLIPISDHIYNDLKSSYGISEDKIQLHRLGTTNVRASRANSDPDAPTDVIRLVSCSRVDPVKRVHLIAEALALYQGDKRIEWHHFGDGLEFLQLEQKIKNLDTRKVTVVLHGWATQEDIYRFYETTYVTWFLNVSDSEGIPVSIMEAMSFGIPVIATDVGGTAEIVNADTGYLLAKSFDIYTLIGRIIPENLNEYVPKRLAAKQMWEDNYKAETNYIKLSTALCNLTK